MSTWEMDLSADNNSTKIFIATCTPKSWCYVHVVLLYALTVYVKNVSVICVYISLVFNLIIFNTIVYSV